ncbi:MAG: hypothetical protein B6245_19275 [Desulfobacteraceae bacterium 4572_88]|nr:MAG: hypothetical protein B6245_19275 [Desulfobacteraceae bacterium 4572_88]
MKFYPLASALMKIVVLTVCVFFPTCPLTAIADNALPASENTIRVSNDGDTLSAQITDADISDVARMLSKAAGIRVLLNQSITHTIRSGFQDVPIETGIKKPGILLRCFSGTVFFRCGQTGHLYFTRQESYRTVLVFNILILKIIKLL